MKLNKLNLLLISILFFLGCAKDNSITLGHEITLESTILGEDRVMSIYLPDGYEDSKDTYPVFYLLDGEVHFHQGSGAVQYLSSVGVIPDMIVVAIHNIDRNRDFSPVHVNNIPTSGGAKKFLKFIGDELMPYINENYRTSSYDVIMGHSFGGVFITNALLDRPELFDAYISISPFLQFNEDYVVKKAEAKLHTSFESEVRFYMCVGEEPAYYNAISDLLILFDENKDPNLKNEYMNFIIEDHNTIPHIAIGKGLRYIFSDWMVSNDVIQAGLDAVDEHYAKVSEKYGMEIEANEGLLNMMGYTFLQNENSEESIKIFKANIERNPDSANVYDSLGEAYETIGQLELAKEYYKKAYDLAVEQNSRFIDIFKANYERMK